MADPRSLYDVLNVAPEAEPVVVEAAYKALIKKYHPDQAAGGPVSRDAAAINEAFAVLKDSGRRSEYDRRLWSKQQALRLAGLKAGGAPAGRPRFAALGGWLVAGLLACALAAVALGKTLAPPPLTTAAEAAEPQDSEAPARAAAAQAAAAEAAHDLAMPSSASVIARVHAQPAARVLRRAERPAPVALRYRKLRPAAAPKAEPRREKDFLERQGYIY
jgi:curved DNA-binding protein CbpA